MIKHISIFILCATLFAACGGSSGEGNSMTNDKPALDVTPDMLATTLDPVCGMDMSRFKISDTAHYNGGIYAFCSEHCKAEFKKDAAGYLSGE